MIVQQIAPNHILEKVDGNGAQRRSPHRAQAAQHGHHDHLDSSLLDEDHIRVDVGILPGPECADDAGEEGRDHEGGDLVQGSVDPSHLCAYLVLADSDKGVAEFTAPDPPD